MTLHLGLIAYLLGGVLYYKAVVRANPVESALYITLPPAAENCLASIDDRSEAAYLVTGRNCPNLATVRDIECGAIFWQ
jgi:hypothetical protein